MYYTVVITKICIKNMWNLLTFNTGCPLYCCRYPIHLTQCEEMAHTVLVDIRDL